MICLNWLICKSIIPRHTGKISFKMLKMFETHTNALTVKTNGLNIDDTAETNEKGCTSLVLLANSPNKTRTANQRCHHTGTKANYFGISAVFGSV